MASATSRAFRWEDLPGLTALIERVRQADGDDRVFDQALLREELGQPDLSPEENCYLFQGPEGLLACALVRHEPAISRSVLEATIHPDHRGPELQRAVLQVARARAKALQAQVLHICLPQQEAPQWASSLEQEGFDPVRVYWSMRWDGDTPPPLEMPPGFSLRPFQPGEGGLLARVQNAAFGGSWGFSPNTPEQVEYQAGRSLTGPGGILFLNQGEETAGYCWTTVENTRGGPPIGSIGMIGVYPAYRGRGLSRPILAAGMQHLHSLGVGHIKLEVDGQNEPAISLYISAGFKKESELHWFEALPSEG